MKATKGESLYVQAKLVITTIDNFMASADEFITTAHTPKYQNDEKAGTKKEVPHNMQMVCWKSHVWNCTFDPAYYEWKRGKTFKRKLVTF